MSKRFTDTDKWKKQFIKGLPSEYKLFWLFIVDECDHSGIWHVEMEVAEARLGIKLSREKIRGFFKEKIVEFDNENKMFIPDFVTFQYGKLNPANKAHSSVINTLSKYKLMGHVSPLQGAMDKDKELDKEPLGIELVKKTAKEVWNSQGWREQICMGMTISEKDLSKWMAQFNSSVSNDCIHNFNDGTYKKMFRGWLSKQQANGHSLKETTSTGSGTLKTVTA